MCSSLLCRFLPSPVLRMLNGPPIDCWTHGDEGNVLFDNDGQDMLVMASAAKSGAVLSARIVVEVFEHELFYHYFKCYLFR